MTVALETSTRLKTLDLPKHRVQPDADFFTEVRHLLGEGAVL